jgi:uncharacterized protein YfaS (alpha-2-macroglobulin family)
MTSIQVYIHNKKTGQPVKDISVEVFYNDGDKFLEGNTDASGLATFEVPGMDTKPVSLLIKDKFKTYTEGKDIRNVKIGEINKFDFEITT